MGSKTSFKMPSVSSSGTISSKSASATSIGGNGEHRGGLRDLTVNNTWMERTGPYRADYKENATQDSISDSRKRPEDLKAEDELDPNHFFKPPNFRNLRNYEQYLDHYITYKDLYYFESEDIARTVMTLGFRVPELYNRQQFKEVMDELNHKKVEKQVGFGINLSEVKCPLIQGLIGREVDTRNGSLDCIVYLRTENGRKQEISGWIDFRTRLKNEDPNTLYEYFTCQRKLLPRPTDLCYYNWHTQQVRFNSSENYSITTDIKKGLQFENKRDGKFITVDPLSSEGPGDNTLVTYFKSPFYEDCAIYDHELREQA